MLSKLLTNYEETAAVILFCIGFSTMLLNKNLLKKIIGMDIMDTAVYLFLASQGYQGAHGSHRRGRHSVRRGVHQPDSRGTRSDGHRRFGQRIGVDAGAVHTPVLPL